ncbi:Hsp20/alpha crystallin family protein [Peterkaempfera griseoplana]|uniref:Hsp20/alpha crystallin family protein n=1 Tax=Peterkaempfera griseoplana TaxID=66896 RepID=UPI0006E30DF0|nr:Hsp20/alpha crystallin family protein [Peterkaempfera griseoplana]
MSAPARRHGHSLFPDLPDWFESLASRPGWPGLPDLATLRIEQYPEGDRYVVKAEIPGIDPGRDLEVTVQEGMLTLQAERTEESRDKDRSEFRYGSLSRTVTLPVGAREDDIRAEYSAGILTISIGMQQEAASPRRIEVTTPKE